MMNINELNITEAVLRSFDRCEDPRLKEILQSLVSHLHAFARETRLTEQEWAQGIDFLTRTGHKCDDKRQEFILLSDTLGLSMLVVAQNHPSDPGTTESTVFGPFHVADAPRYESGADIAGDAPGEPLYVQARVRSTDGTPLANAQVDVWQSDEDGFYDVQYEGKPVMRARGVLRTDREGLLRFRSILPAAYPIPTDGPVGSMLVEAGRHPWRPAHLHFMIEAPGHRRLITHVFRDGDPYLDSDAVFGVRSSLIGDYRRHESPTAPDGQPIDRPFYTLDFDFMLQPDGAHAG